MNYLVLNSAGVVSEKKAASWRFSLQGHINRENVGGNTFGKSITSITRGEGKISLRERESSIAHDTVKRSG